jgi:hypothetical protein
MNPIAPTRAQRRQAIQERMLRNRNLLGKVEANQPWQQPTIL